MAGRSNSPGNRTVAIIDKDPNKWFEQMKQLGHIPAHYDSLDQLKGVVLQLYKEGKTAEEISEATGVSYKNVLGTETFQPSKSATTGEVRGMEMRSAREDIKPDEQLYMRQTFGQDFLDDVKRLRELEWGNKKPRKGEDVEALKERIYSAMDGQFGYERSPTDPNFESAKTTADRGRDRLHSAFGKGNSAAQTHRGHGVSAMYGAGVSSSNLEAEWGPGNVGHGSAPRFDPDTMKALNMSAGDLQALYDGYLKHRGVEINPQRYSGSYVAADESLRELARPEVTGTNNSTGRPVVTAPVEPGRVSPDSIEWRDRMFEDAARQRAVVYEAEGLNPRDALARARSEMLELSWKQSGLYDTTTSVGGPVRTTQVITPEVAEKLKDYLTPQEARRVIAEMTQEAASYNAGLPGFGKQVGTLLRDNLGGTVGGLGTGLMFDKDLHDAVSNKDPLKVATHLGTDAVMGAGTQAAVRALPVAAGAKVAAAMNPVGAVMMAAAAPSSTDQGKQRERLMNHVNKLPPAKKNAAIKQIKADDKAAAKPLIDGNALLKKGINEGKWFLKQLGIKF
jgi:hypothetical protein